jgi:hypothetical protein
MVRPSRNSSFPENRSVEEIVMENKKLWLKQELLERRIQQYEAEMSASNAHCTVMAREATHVQTQYESQKRMVRKSVKTKARFVTHPELKETFEVEKAVRLEKEKEVAEKGAQKAAEDAVRRKQIDQDTISKVFDCSLASYKHKDDLTAISGALSLPTTGTVAELLAKIKEHLNRHPELMANDRFAGLFGVRRRTNNQLSALLPSTQSSGATSLQ